MDCQSLYRECGAFRTKGDLDVPSRFNICYFPFAMFSDITHSYLFLTNILTFLSALRTEENHVVYSCTQHHARKPNLTSCGGLTPINFMYRCEQLYVAGNGTCGNGRFSPFVENLHKWPKLQYLFSFKSLFLHLIVPPSDNRMNSCTEEIHNVRLKWRQWGTAPQKKRLKTFSNRVHS